MIAVRTLGAIAPPSPAVVAALIGLETRED